MTENFVLSLNGKDKIPLPGHTHTSLLDTILLLQLIGIVTTSSHPWLMFTWWFPKIPRSFFLYYCQCNCHTSQITLSDFLFYILKFPCWHSGDSCTSCSICLSFVLQSSQISDVNIVWIEWTSVVVVQGRLHLKTTEAIEVVEWQQGFWGTAMFFQPVVYP